MYKIATLLLLVSLLTGCAAFATAIPVIESALTDSALVLKGIETTYDAYQLAHPVSPADRAEYQQLLAQAYDTLRTGERVVTDAKEVDQGQYDAAFRDFAGAYSTLTAFLKDRGITPASAGLVGLSPDGGAPFPVPRVIGLRISR